MANVYAMKKNLYCVEATVTINVEKKKYLLMIYVFALTDTKKMTLVAAQKDVLLNIHIYLNLASANVMKTLLKKTVNAYVMKEKAI